MSFRRFFSLTVLLVLLLGAPAGAGQGNRVIEALFDGLRTAPDPASAESVENLIWDQWLWHPDAAVQSTMRTGVIDFNDDDYVSALDAFDRAIALDPTYAEAWSRRAATLYMLGDQRAAMRDLRQTLALEPRHFGALATLGLVCLSLNELSSAVRAFDAALALHPHLDKVRHQADSIRGALAGTLL